MPELPDLQVFSRNLNKTIVGKTVRTITVPVARKLNVSAKTLKKKLEGQKLTAVERVGKELQFTFKSGDVLALHLMLRGKLNYFEGKNDARFAIIEILFTDNTGLAMGDFQKAATPTLNPEVRDAPDALSKDADFKFFKTILQKKKSNIKSVLLDQHVVRGIGNAYADDILWEAGISPFSICNQIPDTYIKRLVKSIRSVLHDAEKKILKSNPEIIAGEVRDFMKVHNAKKTHSPTGGKIKQSTTGGRKTYYTGEQELFN
jgi:formamidopyrimidine-DNA glycosylase